VGAVSSASFLRVTAMTMPPQEVEELDVDAAKVEGDVIVEDEGRVEDEVKVHGEVEVEVKVGVDVKVLDEVVL